MLDNLLLNKNMNQKNYMNIVIRNFYFYNCNDYKLMYTRLKNNYFRSTKKFYFRKNTYRII